MSGSWDCHLHLFDPSRAVLDGYYVPPAARLEDILSLAHPFGIEHLVFVQPSVYGTDNRLILDALDQCRGADGGVGPHRAVVVIDSVLPEREWDHWHDLGVRGIRLNLRSPVGRPQEVARLLTALAPGLKSRGWHVQCFVESAQLPEVLRWQRETGLKFVLDHLASFTEQSWLDPRAAQDRSALGSLAQEGAWIKASAWYRLGAAAPYETLNQLLDELVNLFSGRVVWGSDWPHTGMAAQSISYHDLLAPLKRYSAAQQQGILLQNPRELYL
jgi:predicted TIM-barrel fold metal-dependent hydrolase